MTGGLLTPSELMQLAGYLLSSWAFGWCWGRIHLAFVQASEKL